MLIQNTQFNVIYPKISDLRKRVFVLEDKIGSKFVTPFNLMAIPDEAPAEIPRITATSPNGHTTLQISMVNALLNTRFDNNFSGDWKKCVEYVSLRANDLYDSFGTIVANKFLFSGLTTEVLFEDIDHNPVDLIMKNLMSVKSKSKPYDLQGKITLVVDDNFYVNISFTNVRYMEGIISAPDIPGKYLKETKHAIGVVVDINDRYGYNYNIDYVSPPNVLKKIVTIHNEILSEKLESFIREGIIDI